MNEVGSVYPSLQVVSSGSDVTISCYSTVHPTWMKDNKILPYIVLFHTIHIANVTHKDAGIYICKGYLDNEATKPFQAKSMLLVGSR